MKKLILGLLLIVFLFGCTQTQQTGQAQGRTVFTITDAAANMGAVSSVMVTVDSVQAHSETQGWFTVSSTKKTYDLLKLKAEGKQEVLTDINLTEGTYNQVRLQISKVVVTDANGTNEAKLPSGELKIVGDFVVAANTTSVVKFDFVADESLHVTGNGKYILAPVVQFETRDHAEVDVDSQGKVEVRDGNVRTNVKVGMDIDGKVGVGLGVGSNQELEVDSAGKVKVKVGLGSSIGGSSRSANASSETHVAVSV